MQVKFTSKGSLPFFELGKDMKRIEKILEKSIEVCKSHEKRVRCSFWRLLA